MAELELKTRGCPETHRQPQRAARLGLQMQGPGRRGGIRPLSLLMRVKEESEKFLKETKIMESNPITSRKIEGEKVEAVTDFIFLGSKITTDGNCSHKIKRHLLLGRKVMANLDSILKK